MSLRAFLASYVLPKPLKCFISSWTLNRPMNRYLLHFPRGGLSFQSWIPSWPPFRASTVASFTCSVNRSHVHGILFDCANSRSAKLATKENFPENICIKDISRRENAINRKKKFIFLVISWVAPSVIAGMRLLFLRNEQTPWRSWANSNQFNGKGIRIISLCRFEHVISLSFFKLFGKENFIIWPSWVLKIL